MKTVKFLLVIAISLIPILLVTSDSMAWIMTYDLDITRPEEGDRNVGWIWPC